MVLETQGLDIYKRQSSGISTTTNDLATISFPATLVQTVAYTGGFEGTSTLIRTLVVKGKDELDSIFLQSWNVLGTSTSIPTSTLGSTPTTFPIAAESHGLGKKNIVIIIVVVLLVAFLTGLGLGGWILRRRKRQLYETVESSRVQIQSYVGDYRKDDVREKAELPGSLSAAPSGNHGIRKAELSTDANRHELIGQSVWPKSSNVTRE